MHDRPIHIMHANRGGEGSTHVWGKWMVLRVQPDILSAGGFEPTVGAQCNTLDLSLVLLSKDHSWKDFDLPPWKRGGPQVQLRKLALNLL